jgi:hypothetical protein
MPSVYDAENFAGRVNYAATVISRGGRCTRHFDTCCEMYDSDAVVVALYRRSLKNPALAANMWRYLNRESVLDAVERFRGVRNLTAAAARERAENHARVARENAA